MSVGLARTTANRRSALLTGEVFSLVRNTGYTNSMAMMQRIRELFEPKEVVEHEDIVRAAPTSYSIKTLTTKDRTDLMRLSMRCFRGSETYNRETFEYLLREPNVLGYQAITSANNISGFIFVLAHSGNIAHITTIAVAPEHRKRGVAQLLLDHIDKALVLRDFESIVLEVRVSNYAAQNLYSNHGYIIIQKLSSYYNDGEDAYLMSKSLFNDLP